MIRAAIYCRLSDEDRNKKAKTDESESIQNQKSILCEYCKNQSWEIVDIFCDEDMSGADRQRPEFNRMIAMCERGNIDVVVCKTQSRFSREIETVEHYIHGKFIEWGVRFVGVLDHADTNDIRNKKSRQINGLINEWYLEDLSENVKKTLRHKKENGIYTGAFAPYGYKLDKENRGKLFIDEKAAFVVKKIYSMYESGFGYVKIANKLNQENIPNPYEYKRLNGSKFKTNGSTLTSKLWNETEIRNILKNEVYTGTLVQGKTETVSYKSKKRRKINESDYIRIINSHEAIIDAKRWEEINKRIKERKRAQKTGTRHIFSGKIICAECRSAMWKMSYMLKDGRYEYFKCKATKCSNQCANSKSIRYDIVYEAVNSNIRQLFLKYFNLQESDLKEFYTKASGDREKIITMLKDGILKQKLNIKRLYKDKLNDIIDSETFNDIHEEISQEILKAEEKIRQLSKENAPQTDLKEIICNFLKEFKTDEFIINKLVSRIEISQELDGQRRITLFLNV